MLIYVLHELENNMHSTVVGGGVLYMSIKSCLLVLLGSSFFLSICHIDCGEGHSSIYNCNCGFVYFPFQFYRFFFTVAVLLFCKYMYRFRISMCSWSLILSKSYYVPVSVIRFFALKSIILYLIVTYALLLSFV